MAAFLGNRLLSHLIGKMPWVPKQCHNVNIRIEPNGAVMVIFECYLDHETMPQLAEALLKASADHYPPNSTDDLASP